MALYLSVILANAVFSKSFQLLSPDFPDDLYLFMQRPTGSPC